MTAHQHPPRHGHPPRDTEGRQGQEQGATLQTFNKYSTEIPGCRPSSMHASTSSLIDSMAHRYGQHAHPAVGRWKKRSSSDPTDSTREGRQHRTAMNLTSLCNVTKKEEHLLDPNPHHTVKDMRACCCRRATAHDRLGPPRRERAAPVSLPRGRLHTPAKSASHPTATLGCYRNHASPPQNSSPRACKTMPHEESPPSRVPTFAMAAANTLRARPHPIAATRSCL